MRYQRQQQKVVGTMPKRTIWIIAGIVVAAIIVVILVVASTGNGGGGGGGGGYGMMNITYHSTTLLN